MSAEALWGGMNDVPGRVAKGEEADVVDLGADQAAKVVVRELVQDDPRQQQQADEHGPMVRTGLLERRQGLRGRTVLLVFSLLVAFASPVAAVEIPTLPRAADAVSSDLAYDHVKAL